MSDTAGQAARPPIAVPRHLGRRLVRGLLAGGLAVVVAVACLVAGLAWRLSQGPLDVTALVHRAVAALAPAELARFTFGDVSIAWNGFREGIEAPLVVRLTNVATTDPSGAEIASVWSARLELSAASLLLARVVPQAIEVTAARLTLTRASDGSLSLGSGGLGAPTGSSGNVATPLSQLRRVQVHDAAVTVVDHAAGVTWRVPTLEADLRRRDDGGIDGQGHATLALGEQNIDVDVKSAGPGGAVEFHVSPFVPARLAGVAPGLASLAALDAALTLAGRADIGPGLMPTHATATVEVGAGIAHIAQGTSRLNGATLLLDATMTRLDATLRRLELAATPDGAKTLVQAHLLATRANGRIGADITLGLDQVAFADLAALWPAGVGGPGTRPWITANITAGVARDAHAAVTLSAREDFSDMVLGAVNVAIDARDTTVHWLKPVPPIEHIDGHLSMTTPDQIDITATTGHQSGGAVTLSHERVHLTGIADKDQFADIDTDLAGPLADVVALLKNPRLKLLAKSPVPLRDVAGQVTGHLSLVHLPLEDKVALDDIQIKAHTHLTGVHLGGLVAGRDLDRGTLDLDAGNDGMSLRGNAVVAGVPARLGFDMDFRTGPPTQVVEKITAEGVVDQPALAALGMGTSGVLTGPVPVRIEAQFQRGGRGDVAVHADLSRAAVKAAAIDYHKAAGGAASGDLRVVLDHDRIAQVDQLHIIGPGIDIEGAADFAGGRPNVLRVSSLRLGETNLAGEVRLPAKAGEPYAVRLAGPSLDASGLLGGKSASAPSKPNDNTPGTPFSLDARITRVRLTDRAEVTGLMAHVENDGRITRLAHIRGSVAGRAPFSLDVDPVGRGRRLAARAADAGGLLRAAGVLKDMAGGRLAVAGNWDDTNPRHPLAGTVELDDFRIRDAPVLGKILQAMTLYGLVDVVTTGPGLNFTRAVAPFHLAGGVLELTEARAFSASLGMTAKGSIDLDRRRANLEGTVVPAYFFNTLLGKLPLIGRVFSPEKGGGVFAATYSVKGPLDDPSIGVNPLAALTPGFLRGLFDGFQSGGRVPGRDGAGSGGNR